MTDALPPLPEPAAWMDHGTQDVVNAERKSSWEKYFGEGGRIKSKSYTLGLYTADQMRAYARAAVEAERERCARICESVDNYANPMTALDCAAAIRDTK